MEVGGNGGEPQQAQAPTGAGGHAAMEMMRQDTLDKRAASAKTSSVWLDAWMVSFLPLTPFVSTPLEEGTQNFLFFPFAEFC